jgi:hypothetical protein
MEFTMIPNSRRKFLKTLTIGGVAVFTARHLRDIERDAKEAKTHLTIQELYEKTWAELYAAQNDYNEGYRLTLDTPANEFNGMTWREVFDANNEDDVIKVLERLKELGLDGKAGYLEDEHCDNEEVLTAFAASGGVAEDPDWPNWEEVLSVTEPNIIETFAKYKDSELRRLSDVDEICSDWYDRVSSFRTPAGKAYLEVVNLLESIKNVDDDLYHAALDCCEIVEGAGPGNGFHGVFVHTREDLGILRRILHAAGKPVSILIS